MTDDYKSKFKTLNIIVKELREEKNLTKAIQWANSNKENLQQIGSDLLFSLHYAEFAHLLKK